MRALLLVAWLGAGACTPDVVSGAYLCGPEASCPEGQSCSSVKDEDTGLVSDVCVLSSTAQPFMCKPKIDVEPDDTMETGHLIEDLGCVSAPFVNDGCMLEAETADWVTFVAPLTCVAVAVQARLTFPVAHEELGLELWDVDANMQLATDTACKSGLDTSNVRRCLDFTLVKGTKYGVKVTPNGQGTCGGSCAYNRYTLSVQLATPG